MGNFFGLPNRAVGGRLLFPDMQKYRFPLRRHLGNIEACEVLASRPMGYRQLALTEDTYSMLGSSSDLIGFEAAHSNEVLKRNHAGPPPDLLGIHIGCQAFRSGRSISTPRWRAFYVTGCAGDERKEARMPLFSLTFWRWIPRSRCPLRLSPMTSRVFASKLQVLVAPASLH